MHKSSLSGAGGIITLTSSIFFFLKKEIPNGYNENVVIIKNNGIIVNINRAWQ